MATLSELKTRRDELQGLCQTKIARRENAPGKGSGHQFAPLGQGGSTVSGAAPAGEACDPRDKVVAHLGQKYGEVVIARGISTAGARTS